MIGTPWAAAQKWWWWVPHAVIRPGQFPFASIGGTFPWLVISIDYNVFL